MGERGSDRFHAVPMVEHRNAAFRCLAALTREMGEGLCLSLGRLTAAVKLVFTSDSFPADCRIPHGLTSGSDPLLLSGYALRNHVCDSNIARFPAANRSSFSALNADRNRNDALRKRRLL